MNWQDIIGNQQTKEFLQKLLVARQRPHAILLAGPEGIGKRRMAKVFAAALLCGQGEVPCGQCENCRRFYQQNHPDYFFIQPDFKKDSEIRKDSISIEQIRTLIKEAAFAPRLSGNRAVVIAGMELLTAEASNSLLKLLEEPQEGWVFILLAASTAQLLPTVLSRVVLFKMQPPAAEEIVPYLAKKGIDGETAKIAAVLAGGSLGKALKYSELQVMEKRNQAMAFLQKALAGDKETLLDESIEKIEREEALLVCEFIATLARDAWQLKLGRVDSVWHIDKKEEIEKLFALLSIKNLETIVRDAQTAWSAVKNAANARLAMEGLYVALVDIN